MSTPTPDNNTANTNPPKKRMSSNQLLAAADVNEDYEGVSVLRKRTIAEAEVLRRKTAAHDYLSHLPEAAVPEVKPYIPEILGGAIFCGHLVTDLDSIAGAMGAAELYHGTAARASEVNSETAFALKLWGLEAPRPIEELLTEKPEAGVCLVDHQQLSQLNKAIDVDRIVGVIDHHALQSATIVTDKPIYIDIRPWGSMSTIITHTFMTLQRRPTKATAGMLLCAILSDTLNLQGPTTTEWDRLMVTVLVEIAGVEDIQFLATQQFKAKSSELAGLSSMALVNGDCKEFFFKTAAFNGGIGFSVVETTDDDVICVRAEELVIELVRQRAEKKLAVLFLAVVNIVELKSTLLVCGDNERSLAVAAFPDCKPPSSDMPFAMGLGGLVSRKKDFIPAVTKAVNKGGWAPSPSIKQ
jgi:inorganic pyrophosphatase/exopolyphosphatase